jgi:hypothetical protein
MKISGATRLLSLLALAACAPEVIDLATFGIDAGSSSPPPEAGAPAGGELDAEPSQSDAAPDTGRTHSELDARARSDADRGNVTCASKDDCPAGLVCDLVGCGANMKGTCVPAEDCSDERFEAVCDCNGFKYLNDCERRRHGVAKDRECAAERPPCTGKGTCPPTPEGLSTHCGWPAQRSTMTGQCNRGERACFVLPECPGIFGTTSSTLRTVYSACDPAISGAAITMGFEICMTACDAIKLGDQFAPTYPGRCLIAPPRTGGGAGGSGFQP